ncbi:MAG: thiamine diphosphokinase [Clostridia bacterium]|nr:thiamine diphosphokinase [Clostridia bacterium]
MKGILLLNGKPYTGEINADGAVVYCCDGAYKWAKSRVRIDKNIGDFDSLDEVPCPAPEEIYPSEKDFTDGEIALRKMIDGGITEVEIYGGFGGREDHFMGNLQLLYFAHMCGVNAKMVGEDTIVYAAGGKINFKGICGATVSVLPFGGTVHIMGSEGLKYSYPEELCYGECRGISNIVESDCAFVEVQKGGTVLVFINRGKV